MQDDDAGHSEGKMRKYDKLDDDAERWKTRLVDYAFD